jgi:glycosyltransferase involved in cell wall biosynthesis
MIDLSFVVIAYNEEPNILAAISSITSLHRLPSFEIVIVDDGSTDNTYLVAQHLRTRYEAIHVINFESNRGRGAARAAGLAATRGKMIAFVDADIVLPPDWWIQASEVLNTADACGGIAVPDGDVAFVHRIFQLKPRVRPHSTTVTGSNGLFRRTVFNEVSFDEDKRNGEDVDLGNRMREAGLTATSIPGLIVQHRELKSFAESLRWLFESGTGAANQFLERKIWRIPDLATLVFAGTTILSATLTLITGTWAWLFSIPLILLVISAAQMIVKFHYMPSVMNFIGGVCVHATLLLSYFAGRTVGFVLQKKVWQSG